MVVPDGCGESEEPLKYAGDHPVLGTPTVLFQVELPFERVVSRLDELGMGLRNLAPGRGGSFLRAGRIRVALRSFKKVSNSALA